MLTLVQVVALAAVVAAVATVLIGRRLPDVGTCAAGIGLAVVSLRGDTAAYLLVQRADGMAGLQHGLAAKLAVESVAWFAAMMVAVVVSSLVTRWCFGTRLETAAGRGEGDAAWVVVPSGHELPVLGRRLAGGLDVGVTVPLDGLKHTAVALVASLVLIHVLSTGLSQRSVQHGQVCFVVAATVWIASYAAHRIVPVRSALWTLLAVALLAVTGYAWAGLGGFGASASPRPVAVPATVFLRILPIQYIAVGTVAAVAGVWSHAHGPVAPTAARRSGGGSGVARRRT
ncbi:MAG: hypothetical protein ACE5E6_08830 [Phycisphaerae bacterium]